MIFNCLGSIFALAFLFFSSLSVVECACGSKPVIANGKFEGLKIVCDANYYNVVADAIKCLSSGNWQFELKGTPTTNPGRCEAIPCGAMPVIPHSTKDTSIPLRITYECISPYEPDFILLCVCDTATKTWKWPYADSRPPECVIYCGYDVVNVPPTIWNADFDPPNMKYTCKAGYKMINNKGVLKCEDAEWVWDWKSTSEYKTTAPVCAPTRCATPPSIVNAKFTVKEKDMGEYKCNKGYEGAVTMKCDVGASAWKLVGTTPLACERKKCPVPNKIEHASFVELKSYPFATVIAYTCNAGYAKIAGILNDIQCQPNGRWTVNGFKCGILCPMLNPKNASVTPLPGYDKQAEHWTVGRRYRITCNSGFHMGGDKTVVSKDVTCRDTTSGQWTDSNIDCTKGACPNPTAPSNGKLKDYDGKAKAAGEKVQIECHSDKSVKTITCQADLTWTTVTCSKAVVECPNPNIPKNSQLVSFEGNAPNNKAKYKCTNGYAVANGVEGNIVLTCDADGQWNGQGQCEKKPDKCPVPTTPTNSGLKGDIEKYEGGSATFQCLAGSHFVGAGSDIVLVCQANGTWKQEGRCENKATKCNNPKVPDNSSQVNINGYNEGDTATFACNSDSSYSGTGVGKITLTCKADSSWSNDGKCEKKANICRPPVVPKHGRLKGATQQYKGGTATFECVPPAIFVGVGPHIVFVCQADGSWKKQNDSRCKQNACGEPPAVANAHMTHKEGKDIDDEATYECDTDSIYSGPDKGIVTLTCKADKSWTNGGGKCDKKPDICLEPVSLPGTTLSKIEGRYEGATVTLSCRGVESKNLITGVCQGEGKWVFSGKCTATDSAHLIFGREATFVFILSSLITTMYNV